MADPHASEHLLAQLGQRDHDEWIEGHLADLERVVEERLESQRTRAKALSGCVRAVTRAMQRHWIRLDANDIRYRRIASRFGDKPEVVLQQLKAFEADARRLAIVACQSCVFQYECPIKSNEDNMRMVRLLSDTERDSGVTRGRRRRLLLLGAMQQEDPPACREIIGGTLP